LAQALDAWLLASEADGTLSQLRRKYLPAGNQEKTAVPLAALLAAIDERLSLMTGVAESKRVLQKPVEDLQQEARVLDAAVEGVISEAARLGVISPDEASIRAFFQAQIEVAKSIQYRILQGAATTSNPPDLVEDLRPALGRISARINRLIFVLRSESGLDFELVHSKCQEALVRHNLSENHISSIAETLVWLWE
jgi:cyclohexadienyl dehydratase